MSSDREWHRPVALMELANSLRARSSQPKASWETVAARARATVVLARVQRAAIDGALTVDAASDAADDAWPADYVEAFEHLGHADKYGTETAAGLYGLFHHMSEEQLLGLTNAVKGTVMEIRVRDMIQAGEVQGLGESGEEARLAGDLNQAGHDIEILDGGGDVVDVLQVKAGTWASVRGRIDEYAEGEIPVAVTTETAESARSAGYGEAILDTGISGAELTEQTASIVENLTLGHAVDEVVPELALVSLMAAAGLRLRSGEPVANVRVWMTGELRQLGVANAAGVAVQVITGMALLRPVAVLGARWGTARAQTGGEAKIAINRARQGLATVSQRVATARLADQ